MAQRSLLHPFVPGALLCFVLLLMTACSSLPASLSNGSTSATGSPNSKNQNSNSNQNTVQTTVPMPKTDTSCPAANTARAAVMRPLALGNQQNLVYIYNEVPKNTTIAYGHLRRYNLATQQKTEIVTSGVRIDQAQVSADGQWVLFLSIPDARGDRQHSALLQLVRMDGQGLQTLYCFPNLAYSGYGHVTKMPAIQWSVDEKSILVSVNTQNTTNQIFVIHVADGSLRQLFLDQQDSTYYYSVVTWLDSSRFYVLKIHQPTTSHPEVETIFLMNASTATVAHPGLTQVVASAPSLTAFSIDSSYDGTQLFASSCLFQSGSTVTTEPATGGTARYLLRNDPTDCVLGLRAYSPSNLLLLVDVFNPNWNGFSTQVWTLSPTDGHTQSLVSLSSSPTTDAQYNFNENSQFPWSNVSRDGHSYALMASSYGIQSILLGSLNGGNVINIASTGGLSSVSLAGWTTM